MQREVGLRLLRLKFVRTAIQDKADLSAFQEPPNFRIFAGIFCICFSFIMAWPAISAVGTFSIYVGMPWLVLVVGPILYFASHGCFILGMALSGEKYTRIILRWAARHGVEKLLGVPRKPAHQALAPR